MVLCVVWDEYNWNGSSSFNSVDFTHMLGRSQFLVVYFYYCWPFIDCWLLTVWHDGGLGQPGTYFWQPLEKHESWIGTKQLAFCSGYNGKYTKEIFKVHEAWHSPNTWPIMVHGQVVRIIWWQSLINKAGHVRYLCHVIGSSVGGVVGIVISLPFINYNYCCILIFSFSLCSFYNFLRDKDQNRSFMIKTLIQFIMKQLRWH